MSSKYYTELHHAKNRLEKRRSAKREVEAYWKTEGLSMQHYIDIGLFAGFARQVPTFRMEDAVFNYMAESAGLPPVWMGYTADKLSTQSSLKRSYLQPKIWNTSSKKGNPVVAKSTLADINSYVGARLDSVRSTQGNPIVGLHRERLRTAVPNAIITDDSEWMVQYGSPDKYYDTFLSVFLAHGVLFEDYHGGESGEKLNRFTSEVFEPAVERLESRFGIRPLVVKMPWHDDLTLYPNGKVLAWNKILAKGYLDI